MYDQLQENPSRLTTVTTDRLIRPTWPPLQPASRFQPMVLKNWPNPQPRIRPSKELLLLPIFNLNPETLAQYANLTSISENTEEGEKLFLSSMRYCAALFVPTGAKLIPWHSNELIGGIDLKETKIRKGTLVSVLAWLRGENQEPTIPLSIRRIIERLNHWGISNWIIASSLGELGLVVNQSSRYPKLKDSLNKASSP